jgi:bifunctional UDP-N-acetylglucosamine pyrophosphorylase / glucosamine-1-phosphate N-acetyltransferase
LAKAATTLAVLLVFGTASAVLADANDRTDYHWSFAQRPVSKMSSDPAGYGRLVLKGGELVAIREELDASPAERAIELCNGGLMAFAGPSVLAIPSESATTIVKANIISPMPSASPERWEARLW